MGVVRTNIVCENGTTVVGGTVDLPTRLNTLSANGGNGFVTLSLGYSNTSYITGVQVNYKTGSYPASPTDGSSVKVSGAATSVKITGLTNGTTYYFRVFLYRVVNNVTYYQTDITNARVTGLPIGVTITGITPLVAATDHIVINKSGTFTLTAPKGARIIIGGGGENATPLRPDATSYSMKEHNFGGKSGYVFETTLTSDVVGASCTLSLATNYTNGSSPTISSLKIGTTTYKSSSGTAAPLSTKWGPIGGKGGDAPSYSTENSYLESDNSSNGHKGYAQLTGADGAGGGGGELVRSSELGDQYVQYLTKFKPGGNSNGYGNKGGNGGDLTTATYGAGENGSSGAGGNRPRLLCADDGNVNHHYPYPENDSRDTAYRCAGSGGGGGYSAGGGAGAWYLDYRDDGDHGWCRGNPGEGGDGVLIIEWDP